MEYIIKKDHQLIGDTVICPQMDNISTSLDFVIEDEKLWDKDLFLEFRVGKDKKGYETSKLVIKDGKSSYLLPNGILTSKCFYLDVVFRNDDGFVWKTYTKKFIVPDALLVSDKDLPIEYPDFVNEAQAILDECLEAVNDKQDKLISGVNIKTINGEDILGSGNIEIKGGSGDDVYTKEETDELLDTKADKSNTYNKTEIDNKLNTKANKTDVYTKTETDDTFATKEFVLEKDEGKKPTYVVDTINDIKNLFNIVKEDDHYVLFKNNKIVFVGTSILIKDLNVPDYWVSSNYSLSNDVMSFLSPLETQKIDLTDYYTKEQTNDLLNNKANVDDIPTKTSQLENDSGFVTNAKLNAGLSAKADKEEVYTKSEVDNKLDAKQDTLVSGTNIKTINGQSILGEGNIDVGSDDTYTKEETDALLDTKADKSTTLAGYGITNAYTKEETDNQIYNALTTKIVVELDGEY